MPDLESHYPSQARSAAAWLGEIARLSQTKVNESTELSHFTIFKTSRFIFHKLCTKFKRKHETIFWHCLPSSTWQKWPICQICSDLSVLLGMRRWASCHAAQARDGVELAVLQSYCWMYSTLRIPIEYKGACSGQGWLNIRDIYARDVDPWNNGKEVPRWGVAGIQKMSPLTTERCYCCH